MPTAINIHTLQAQASKTVRRTESGEVFEVIRYSKPVAILLSKKEYDRLQSECRDCVRHWSTVTGKDLTKSKAKK